MSLKLSIIVCHWLIIAKSIADSFAFSWIQWKFVKPSFARKISRCSAHCPEFDKRISRFCDSLSFVMESSTEKTAFGRNFVYLWLMHVKCRGILKFWRVHSMLKFLLSMSVISCNWYLFITGGFVHSQKIETYENAYNEHKYLNNIFIK